MRILFIGNSHTYMNALPYQVRAMVNRTEGDGACEVCMLAPGGKSLGWHAGEPETRMAIAYHHWDFIVLQQNTHPFDGYDELARQYGKLAPFLERGRETGSGVVSGPQGNDSRPRFPRVQMYETWAMKNRPEDQAELSAAFSRLASERGLRLVPVATAWRRAIAQMPGVNLHAPDESHAGPAGTYLAACVFYAALTGRSPEGLPARIEVAGDVLADLPDEQAAAFQTIAWQTVADQRR